MVVRWRSIGCVLCLLHQGEIGCVKTEQFRYILPNTTGFGTRLWVKSVVIPQSPVLRSIVLD